MEIGFSRSPPHGCLQTKTCSSNVIDFLFLFFLKIQLMFFYDNIIRSVGFKHNNAFCLGGTNHVVLLLAPYSSPLTPNLLTGRVPERSFFNTEKLFSKINFNDSIDDR